MLVKRLSLYVQSCMVNLRLQFISSYIINGPRNEVLCTEHCAELLPPLLRIRKVPDSSAGQQTAYAEKVFVVSSVPLDKLQNSALN